MDGFVRTGWVASIVGLVGLGGCSDGGGKESGVSLDPENYGGYVSLYTASGDETQLSAAFYEDIEFDEVVEPIRYEATDECIEVDFDEDGPTASEFESFDVGDELTAKGGGDEVVADREESDDHIRYHGWEEEDFDGGTYEIRGSDEGAIVDVRLPERIILAGGNPEIDPSEPYDLEFTADTGADYVQVFVSGEDDDWICNSRDDGTFTLPAEVTEEAGDYPWVTLTAVSVKVVQFHGRDLLVLAQSANTYGEDDD